MYGAEAVVNRRTEAPRESAMIELSYRKLMAAAECFDLGPPLAGTSRYQDFGNGLRLPPQKLADRMKSVGEASFGNGRISRRPFRPP